MHQHSTDESLPTPATLWAIIPREEHACVSFILTHIQNLKNLISKTTIYNDIYFNHRIIRKDARAFPKMHIIICKVTNNLKY